MISFVYIELRSRRNLLFNSTSDDVENSKNHSTLINLVFLFIFAIMPTMQSPKASPGRPRARKSIAHFPLQDSSADVEKENTEELLSNAGTISKPIKKTRSKSFGPGGLEALKEETGNRQKV